MKKIKFQYTNWHGNDHEYVMMPEPTLSFGTYNDEEMTWLISGHVFRRDNEVRSVRRTFKLTNMRNIELVNE